MDAVVGKMLAPGAFYTLLSQRIRASSAIIDNVLLGINWTVVEACQDVAPDSAGLCFSPLDIPRNLPWSGTLAGRRAAEFADWVDSEDPCQRAIALAVVNGVLNHSENSLISDAEPLPAGEFPHLSVFEHFAPQLRGASVAVIGRYPNLDRYRNQFEFVCIERRPGPGDLPEAAASWALPQADWVFITASSIANHTLPQLLALCRQAKVVLMGPSLPWLPEWVDFGVDYLAGVEVLDSALLKRIVAEAGGTRIFEEAVRYRVLSF